MRYFIIHLIVMNIIGFAVMGIDKSKARNHKWRTRERTMFFIAILGGSIGIKAGMQHFRHKTQHKKFVYGIPAIIIIQLVAVICAIYLLYIK